MRTAVSVMFVFLNLIDMCCCNPIISKTFVESILKAERDSENEINSFIDNFSHKATKSVLEDIRLNYNIGSIECAGDQCFFNKKGQLISRLGTKKESQFVYRYKIEFSYFISDGLTRVEYYSFFVFN